MTQVTGRYHDLVRSDVFPALPANLGKILDFGGGVGATAAKLKSDGRAVFAVLADRVAENALDGIDAAFSGDLEDVEFIRMVVANAGPFDTILALDILEHLRDPWRVVEVLRDALVPNGVIVASIPNVNHYKLVMPLVLRGRYELQESGILDKTHLRWFVERGAVELMSPPGLKVEVVIPNILGLALVRLNRVTLGRLNRFLALQYVIRARRVGE